MPVRTSARNKPSPTPQRENYFTFTETATLRNDSEKDTEEAYIQSVSPLGYWLATVSPTQVTFWNTLTMLPARHYPLSPPLPSVSAVRWIPMGLALVSNGRLYILKATYITSFPLIPPSITTKKQTDEIWDIHFYSDLLVLTCQEGLMIHGLRSNLRCLQKLSLLPIHASNVRGYQVLVDPSLNVLVVCESRPVYKIPSFKQVISSVAIDQTGQFVLVGQQTRISLYHQSSLVTSLDVDYSDFIGFLSPSVIYSVSSQHNITVVDLNNKQRTQAKGPIAQIISVTPHPKDQSLFLLTDTGMLYKWLFQESFLESALIPYFTQITVDNILVEDCAEEKFKWRPVGPSRTRVDVLVGIPREQLFIKNESWFLNL